MSFRKYQAIFDLQKAASYLVDCLTRDLTSFEMGVREKFAANMPERASDWQIAVPDDVWPKLALVSCSPENGKEEFLLATCLLILDRFVKAHRGGDFQWEWDAFAKHYREAPPRIRSAIMNGLEEARKLGFVSESIQPSVADRSTVTQDEIVSALIEIARKLTPEEREVVSIQDYGDDAEKHLSALNQVLASKTCRFTDSWYPAETVELVSYVPGETGFVGCTALVLLNAIYDGDDVGHAEFRWQTKRFAYHDMTDDARKQILGAFRHLYETAEFWSPFDDEFAPERLRIPSFIPWELEGFTAQVARD